MMWSAFSIMMALCGPPKMSMCFVESIDCKARGKEMVCTFGVVIRKDGKTTRKSFKVKRK